MVDLEKFGRGLGVHTYALQVHKLLSNEIQGHRECHFTESFILMKRKACKGCIRILHVEKALEYPL